MVTALNFPVKPVPMMPSTAMATLDQSLNSSYLSMLQPIALQRSICTAKRSLHLFISPTSTICAGTPCSIKWRAATRPSAPLLPLPHMNKTKLFMERPLFRENKSYSPHKASTIPRPAFSMRISKEIPNCLGTSRSINRASSVVKIFILCSFKYNCTHCIILAMTNRYMNISIT